MTSNTAKASTATEEMAGRDLQEPAINSPEEFLMRVATLQVKDDESTLHLYLTSENPWAEPPNGKEKSLGQYDILENTTSKQTPLQLNLLC
jgi:hypothetical protein